ncbi:MAG: hypothetical protein HC831_01530 [Chloroflexia bacterium]|nr:hypothetical protein [Chloroflexia bacterium]
MSKKESEVKKWVSDEVHHLLKNADKIYTQELKRMAVENPEMLDLLVKIFLTDEEKLCWHAGWVLFKIADTHTKQLEKYVPGIIQKLPNMLYTQQAHGALRIIKHYDIKDEELQGILVDTGIRFILENKYAPNLKYFSIVIIEKIAKYYPELKNELALTIEEALPHWTTNYIVKFGKQKLLAYR